MITGIGSQHPFAMARLTTGESGHGPRRFLQRLHSSTNSRRPNVAAPVTVLCPDSPAYFTVYFDRSSRGFGQVSCIDSNVSHTCFAMT